MINLNKKLFSITFASGVQGALQGIFMAYLGLHANYLGASALIIGLIFFSRNFFQIFLRVPFGELSQITGRRPLILLGCGFFVFSYFLMYAAETWILIFGSTILFAIGMAFYYPSLFSYIGDIATDNYGKVNGIVFQGSDIGLILSALITNYSLRNDLVDLKNLFGYGFLIGILCLIVMFIILKESIDEVNRKVVTNKLNHIVNIFRRSLNSLVGLTKHDILSRVYLFQFIISFTEFFFVSFIPLLIVFHIGLFEEDVANIIFVSTCVVFLFKPFLGSISDRFGFKRPVLVGLSLNSIILISITFSTNIIEVIILYSLFISFSIMCYLGVNGATSYSVDEKMRGLAMGGLGFWVSFGRSFSSGFLTPIWSYFESISDDKGIAIRNLFWISAGVILIFVGILSNISKNLVIKKNSR